jgi:large repetitive protein
MFPAQMKSHGTPHRVVPLFWRLTGQDFVMDIDNQLSTDTQNAALASGVGAALPLAAGASSDMMAAVIQTLTMLPDATDQVVLPSGVGLDDISVSGRNLIIKLPDGSEMLIPDGAIFIPQFVLNGVAVPPLNIAALLIGQEPAPAAGRPTSSGGNFADPVGNIGDPFSLGDLLGPTELTFANPDEREIIPDLVDEEPTTIIITPDQPAGSVSATARVNEAGLPGRGSEPAGSDAASNNETTAGSIVFETPDGFGSITLNGTAVTTVGQVIVTPQGRLTITSITPGSVGYSYTLTDNTSGDNTADVFVVVVTDSDGDTATANLTIAIIDDVPTARNDTDIVPAANYAAQTGNVITGVGTTSGSAGADTQGADGATVSGFRAGTSGSLAGVGNTINGQYGALRMNADGSYIYTRSAGTPGGVNDSFSYQLTDGDGDVSTATLVISIADSPVSITSVPTTGASTIVFEEGLPPRGTEPAGSNSAAASEATSGTITFTAPDGVASVQINGITITGVGQVIILPTGTFAISSFDPLAGTLGYTFTLIDNTSGATTTQALTVTVTDTDGDSDVRPFTITIIDDAPTARNDSGVQTTENAAVSINVFANDIQGADAVSLSAGVAVVPGTLSGGGVLVYDNDGTFIYTPAAGEEGTVSFQYRITDGDGDSSTATVTITLLRDSIPAIEITGDREVEEAGLQARGTEPAGSNAASNSEIASGTFNISTGNDSISALVINGINVTNGGSVIGASGTLSVTLSGSTYSYIYTLTDNTSGDATSDSFAIVLSDSDGDSANSTLVIAIVDDQPIAVNDTDSVAAGQYGPATGNVITDGEGDGGADTSGADGVLVSAITGTADGIVGGTTAGQYGVLTLNAVGSYSYVRNAETPGGVSDTFFYTVRDGDGDTSTASLVIRIADSPTSLDLPATGEDGTHVDEAGLPAGSNAASNGETTAGTIAYTAPDGPATVTIDGVAVTAVGQSFVGSFGAITITSISDSAIGYDYTLTTNTSGNATFDDFAVVVTDQDGDATAGILVIDIVDDVPTARPDVDSVTEDVAIIADGNVISGSGGSDSNVTDGAADSRGADGATVTAIAFGTAAGVVGGATSGAYGTLTINADGSYSYALNNSLTVVQGLDSDDTLTEVFTYVLTDGDGAARATTLTIAINGSDDPITINGLDLQGPELVVDEDDLADGSSPSAAALTPTGSFTVNGIDGIAAIQIEGANVTVGHSFTTAYGVFTITSLSAPVDGNATTITVGYSYTLTNSTAHPNAGGENFLTEIFDIAVIDTDGSTDTDTIEVRIIDDVPTAVNDTDSIASGSDAPATGNVISDGEGDGGTDTRGADGAFVTAIAGASPGMVGGTTAGTYGILTLNTDGSYSYVRNSGTPGNVQDVFTYTLTDADGDITAATLTIDIEDAQPVTGPNATVLLDDDALAGGNNGGVNDDFDAQNVNGILSGSGGDGALTWAYLTTGAPAGFTYVANGTGIDVLQGATVVLRVTLDTASGAYAVAQLAPVQHANGSDENNQLFTLGYRVTDTDGDSATGTLTINVDDDTPIIVADGEAPSLTVDETSFGNNATENLSGLFTSPPDYGADGVGSVTYALGVVAGQSNLVDTLTGQSVVLSLEAGIVVGRAGAGGAIVFNVNVDASGNVTLDQSRAVVHAPNGGPNDIAALTGNLVTLTQTLTDRDGDSATATSDIGAMLRFVDDAPTAINTVIGGVVDEDGLGNGVSGGNADVGGEATAATGFVTGLFNSGADNPLTYQLTGSTAGLPALSSGGVAVTYALAGNILTASAGANPVFTLTLNATTGQWDFVLLRALDHPNGGNENDLFLNFGSLLQATDADGDSVAATGVLQIIIDDDSPLVSNNAAGAFVSVDENSANSGGFPISASSAGAVISATLDIGADGAATAGTPTYAISLTAGSATPLVTALGGFPIILVQVDATTIAGQFNNGGTQTAFTIAIDPATGIATLTQNVALEHNTDGPTGPAHNDFLTLAGLITATVIITDRDGDTHSGNTQIGGNLRFFDDGPAAVADANSVSEGAIVTGNVLNDGVDDGFGADGAAVTTPTGGVVGVAAGSNTSIAILGGVGTAITTGLGTLTLNADGSYTYDALPNTTAATVTDTFVYTIMDSDGDSSTVTLTITINPVTLVADNDVITVNEAALNAVGSNPGSNDETTGGTLSVTGATGFTLPTGGTGTYGTLMLNANGSYSYTLTAPYDSATADNGTNTELGRDVFTYTATDANGNTITGTITVDIIDDVPTARDDAAGLSEGGPISITLDVDTNDTPGADGTASRTFTTLTGIYGNLVLNGDGTQTYTLTTAGQAAINALSPGAALQDAFSYTLTDSDGDTDPATLMITLTGTDDPVTISNLTPATNGGDALVDEDDLAEGSDSTPDSLIGTGNFTITAPDGVDDLTVGGVVVILNGVYQAPAAVTTALGNILTFTGYNVSTGLVSYSYTLAGAQTHANAAGQNDLYENFAVSLTDVDGDTATDTLSVRIVDDVPAANDDMIIQAVENSPLIFSVFGNDVFGADGVDTDNSPVVNVTFTQPPSGQGNVSYNATTGQFTFTQAPGQTGSTSFTYTIADADGDSDPASVTINLQDDSAPITVNAVAAVDDDALAGGNVASTTGDINANTGEPGATASEAIYTGAIAVNFGNDTGTVSFANLNGTTGVVGSETVNYSWNAGTNTLTATGPRGVLFTVSLTPSGAYTVTLVDNILHASGGNESSAPLVNLNYLATDSDGDMSTAGVLTITFNDDAPTLGTIQNQQISNIPSNPVATGTLNFAAGADGAGTTMTIAANLTGITSGGRTIVTQQVGNVLTGYADVDNSGTFTAGDTSVFTLTANPSAGASGQYVFDLLAPLDGVTSNVSVGSGSSFGVGPSNSVVVSDGATGTQLTLVTGWLPTGGFTSAEAAAWQAGGTPTLTQQSNVNGSTAGWGLGNNNLDAGEFLRFDFGVLNDYDGAGGYTPPAGGPFANVSFASFSFENFAAGDTVIFVAHYTDGSTATFTRVGGTDPDTLTINSPAGLQLAWIDVYESSGSIKLNLTNVGVTSTVVDRTIPFTLQLTDADGDVTTTGAFTVRVGGSFAPFAPSAEAISLAKFGADVITYSDTAPANDHGGALTQPQHRQTAQANALVAASLVALVNADIFPNATSIDLVSDLHRVSNVDVDVLTSRGPMAEQLPAMNLALANNADSIAIDMIEPIALDTMQTPFIWDTTGLAPQEQPVAQPAYSALSDPVQLPSSGASMMALTSDTGLIDALLLVRETPTEIAELPLPALHAVLADTINDNDIDHLLHQLAGPPSEDFSGSANGMRGGAGDYSSALIDMPISNDVITYFAMPNIVDQQQEMTT